MVRGFSHDTFWSCHSHSNDDYDDNDYGMIIRIQTSPPPLLGCPQSSAEKIFHSEELHFLQIPTLNPMLCICTHSSSHHWGFTIFLSYNSPILFRLKTYFWDYKNILITQVLSHGLKKFTTCCVLFDTPLWKTMRQTVSGKYEAHYLRFSKQEALNRRNNRGLLRLQSWTLSEMFINLRRPLLLISQNSL